MALVDTDATAAEHNTILPRDGPHQRELVTSLADQVARLQAELAARNFMLALRPTPTDQPSTTPPPSEPQQVAKKSQGLWAKLRQPSPEPLAVAAEPLKPPVATLAEQTIAELGIQPAMVEQGEIRRATAIELIKIIVELAYHGRTQGAKILLVGCDLSLDITLELFGGMLGKGPDPATAKKLYQEISGWIGEDEGANSGRIQYLAHGGAVFSDEKLNRRVSQTVSQLAESLGYPLEHMVSILISNGLLAFFPRPESGTRILQVKNPRPYGRGFRRLQTSFALRLFYPDPQCIWQ